MTFEKFKKDFYGKVQDLTLYDCGDFNILKVVLDGLKVNYVSKGKFRTPLFYSDIFWNLWVGLQRARKKANKPASDGEARVLLADLSGRSESRREDVPTSFYFQEFKENLAPGQSLHVVENFKEPKYPHNIDLRKYQALQYLPFSDTEKKIRKDLITTYKRIESSKKFDTEELANIKIAIQVFFTQFKVWNEFLSQFPNLSQALLEQHYHHEGLLLALRKRSIRATEIQHGLIAPSDIFYVFPKQIESIRERALFPERILVYGNYWKDVLKKGSEFTDDNIIVIGDFRKKNETPGTEDERKIIEEFTANSKIILICGQTFMSDFYSDYTKKLSALLSSKHPGWKIIVKLHPNEKTEDYSAVKGLSNVLVSRTNIHYLFRKAQVQISVYSTTLYDGLEYGATNFSLNHEKYRDYTQDILADNIALPLTENEDPVDKYLANLNNNNTVDPESVYSPFNKELFKKILLN